MKLTTTEVTTRKVIKMIEDYEFMLQAIEDGSVTYSRKFSNAVEAVTAYNGFRDHGFARYSREVVLVEPNGKIHAKEFKTPAGIPIG